MSTHTAGAVRSRLGWLRGIAVAAVTAACTALMLVAVATGVRVVVG